jgi:UDP-3-O-[3-hydroxymyristoyl] N-acetylglucosamine deacetylase
MAGIGLHTGADCTVQVHPAETADVAAGFFFRHAGAVRRIDPTCVVDTRRCTAVQIGDGRVQTIEHLMSALAGCGVTDAVIDVEGPELPIFDGSATAWCSVLLGAGLSTLDGEITPIKVEAPLDVVGERGERLVALPSDRFRATVILEYPDHPAIGTQAASYDSALGDYAAEIAPARTYGFLAEIEQIRALGLATGASWESGVALEADGSADPRTPLRFPNELARHKLLDLIGDLALVGRPIQGEIIAIRPSHAVNCRLAATLPA